MMLKQSTAAVISFGPFVSPTDGVTLQTGLVSAIDNGSTGIMLSKAGGAFAVRHASVTASTYDAYGNYLVTLDTTDTNTLGRLRMQFAAAASCLPVWQDFEVVAANVYDSLIGGGDVLDVSVTQWLGTAVTAATAGVPDVNTKNINNTAAATPGASGGILISGSNSGTTTLAALTVTGATTLTGNVALADGMTIAAPSTANRAGLTITGNGTGSGISTTGGATGHGLLSTGGATSGDGLRSIGPTSGNGAYFTATTSGHGIRTQAAGTTKHGIFAEGGATTGDGIRANGGATSGNGAVFQALASGDGLDLTGVGSNKRGLTVAGAGTGAAARFTGGTSADTNGLEIVSAAASGAGYGLAAFGSDTGAGIAGVGGSGGGHGFEADGGTGGDGIKAVAGAGGVDIRGNLTGDITGDLSGSVGSVTGNVGGDVAGNVDGNLGGTINGLTATALADFFTTDSGETYASSVAGSVVQEIADNAGAGADPWSTPLPGAYGSGEAGFIVGTNLDALISSRLAPTVAARTLDVSAGGEAGIDWNNIGSPTTTQNLSGTTVKTATDVAGLLPAALVGGRMDSSVGAMAANVITASALATNAVDEIVAGVLAGIVDGTVDLAEGIKRILAAVVNTITVTGSSPAVLQLNESDGTTPLGTQSIAADGSSRTTSIP